MKIGFIIYGNLNTVSGGYLYDRILTDYLKKQGEKVTVFSLPPGRPLRQNYSSAVPDAIHKANLDILIEDELTHPSIIRTNHLLNRRKRIPIVSLIHLLNLSLPHAHLKKFFLDRMEKTYLRSVDGFIFNSITSQNLTWAAIGIQKPSVVAYPAADRFQRLASRSEIFERFTRTRHLELLFLGNVIRRKGLLLLLKILDQWPSRNWRLRVAGNLTMEPRYAAQIQTFIRRNFPKGQVVLLGVQNIEGVQHLLQTSHILAMPFSYEAFGMSYLESMAFGVIPIASTQGAVREFVKDNQTGFLIPPDKPDIFLQKLEFLQNHPDEAAKIALQARKRFETHPTWNETCAQIHNFLKQIAQHKSYSFG